MTFVKALMCPEHDVSQVHRTIYNNIRKNARAFLTNFTNVSFNLYDSAREMYIKQVFDVLLAENFTLNEGWETLKDFSTRIQYVHETNN